MCLQHRSARRPAPQKQPELLEWQLAAFEPRVREQTETDAARAAPVSSIASSDLTTAALGTEHIFTEQGASQKLFNLRLGRNLVEIVHVHIVGYATSDLDYPGQMLEYHLEGRRAVGQVRPHGFNFRENRVRFFLFAGVC